MKAPNKELRTFIYNRLNGSIVYNTRTIPVDSVPAKGSVFSLIHIGDISVVDKSTKDRYGTVSSVNIEVVYQATDALANYDECESISDQVIDKLVDYISDTPNFNIVWALFSGSQEQTELTDTAYTIKNIITIEYFTQEL